MPESNSIYDIYAGAGKAMGEYEASWGRVGDVWEDISFGERRTAQRSEQRETTADTLMALVETGSTLVGGALERKKFKEQTLPGMQRVAAEESYTKGLGREKGALSFEKFVGTEKGKEFYSKFKGGEVGMTGKSWKDLSFWEKLGQEKMYQFGEGTGAYTLGKGDITGIMEGRKYGYDADLSGFQRDFVPEIAEIDRGETEVERLKVDKSKDDLLEQLDTESKKGYEEYVEKRGDAVTLKLKGGDYTQQLDPDTAESVLKAAPNLWERMGGLGTEEKNIPMMREAQGGVGPPWPPEPVNILEKPELKSSYQRPRGGGGRMY